MKYITPEEYEIAAGNGISEKTVNARVRRSGWSVKRAITEPVRKRMKHGEWVKLAKKNNISPSTYSTRIHHLKWTPEEAATTPVMTKREAGEQTKPSPRIKLSKELIEKAEKHDISRKNLYSRIKLGWDEEEAATFPILTKAEAGRRGVIIREIKRKRG